MEAFLFRGCSLTFRKRTTADLCANLVYEIFTNLARTETGNNASLNRKATIMDGGIGQREAKPGLLE